MNDDSELTFDKTTGSFSFSSIEQNNTLIPFGSYSIAIKALAGTSLDVTNEVIKSLELSCMLNVTEF